MSDALSEAVLAGAPGDTLERLPLPAHYTAAHTRIEDVGTFTGMSATDDKDVRKTLHVGPVPMPSLAPDEVLIAVMASSINYNAVWSATFHPLPTFDFLKRYARQGGHATRHDLPDKRMAFHCPCTLQHAQKLGGAVEDVLTRLGFQLTAVPDAHLCCGSAGSYSITQPALSKQLRDNKLTALESGKPEMIVTANIGCQTHLDGAGRTPVRHWIEIVEEAMG